MKGFCSNELCRAPNNMEFCIFKTSIRSSEYYLDIIKTISHQREIATKEGYISDGVRIHPHLQELPSRNTSISNEKGG